jgi:hypothetical protein
MHTTVQLACSMLEVTTEANVFEGPLGKNLALENYPIQIVFTDHIPVSTLTCLLGMLHISQPYDH